jgi:hypothetical protein
MQRTTSGYKYVQSFIDGRTRLKNIYLLKKKSDSGGVLRDFIVKFERELDCLVESVHADNAAEFTSGDFNSCLREQGIKFTSSAFYALLRMRPLSMSSAEGFVVISCGKVDYDKSGWRDD